MSASGGSDPSGAGRTAARQDSPRTQECYVCARNAAVGDDLRTWERVHIDGHWRLALGFDSSLPGWLVLLPRRHVVGLHELDEDEAGDLGRLLRAASTALVEVTGCLRTYVMLFAEAEGFAHLHFHIVPRAADLVSDQRGPAVFAHLGAPPEHRVPEPERNVLAVELRQALNLPSSV